MQPTKSIGIIKCIPFHISLKEYVISKVLLNNLKLKQNFSFEGGFELPLTNDWLNYEKLNNKHLLKYHNSRQVRFVIDNDYIIGLRLKDNINYMSDDELNEIITLINNIFLSPI